MSDRRRSGRQLSPADLIRYGFRWGAGLLVVSAGLATLLPLIGSGPGAWGSEDSDGAWFLVPLLAMLGVMYVGVAAVFWLRGRRRGDRYAADAPLPPPEHEPGLGQVVATSSTLLQRGLVIVGLIVAAGLLGVGVLGAGTDWSAVLGALTVAVAVVALAAMVQWYEGGDGVWATEDELVSRSGRVVRRWSWDEVLALGCTLNQAGSLALRFHDPQRRDALSDRSWITLFGSTSDPLGRYRAMRRLRRLAEQHDLPFVDTLTGEDLVHGPKPLREPREPRMR